MAKERADLRESYNGLSLLMQDVLSIDTNLFQMLSQNEALTVINISDNDETLSRFELSQHIKHLNAHRQGRGEPPVTIIHLLEGERK